MAYRGNVARIPLGSLGLLTDVGPNEIPASALLRADNITLANGTVQKAPGTRKLNSVALPAGVVSLSDWRPNSVTQQTFAACSNGSLYKDIGTGFFAGNVAVHTGLVGLTPNSMFVQGGNEVAGQPKRLFFFSFGENQIKVLSQDGGSFADIESPATDWADGRYPKVGVIHRDRLWVFSGQIGYASDSGNHQNFTSNFLVGPIYPGEGDDIRGAYVYKGRLFCFKDGGFSYWLNDDDTDDANWYWQKLASNFGLAAPNAVCEALDDLFAANTNGTLTSYKATQTLGSVAASDVFLFAKVENYIRNNSSRTGLTERHCLYYPDKKQFYMTGRSGYSTHNDMLIVVDLNRQDTGPRVLLQKKGTPQCLALRKDINEIERPMYGDSAGFVHFMDYEDRLEGGTAYRGEFQTVHFDMSHLDPNLASKNKQFDFLGVTYAPESAGDLSCDYFVDGVFVDTITFPLIQYASSKLDILHLDRDRLAQANPETFTHPIAGMGRTISFRFYNSGSNQSFQISGIVVSFRVTSNQAQKD